MSSKEKNLRRKPRPQNSPAILLLNSSTITTSGDTTTLFTSQNPSITEDSSRIENNSTGIDTSITSTTKSLRHPKRSTKAGKYAELSSETSEPSTSTSTNVSFSQGTFQYRKKLHAKPNLGRRLPPTASSMSEAGSSSEHSPVKPTPALIRKAKFNKPGILRKKLEPTDPLYKKGKLKQGAAGMAAPKRKSEKVPGNVVFPEGAAEEESSRPVPLTRFNNWVDKSIAVTKGKRLTDILTPEGKGPRIKSVDSAVSIITEIKGKKNLHHAGSLESIADSTTSAGRRRKEEKNRDSKDVLMILHPKRSLKRTEGKGNLSVSHSVRHRHNRGVVRATPVVHAISHHHPTRVTKSETQARKGLLDGWIHNMLDADDDADYADYDSDDDADSIELKRKSKKHKLYRAGTGKLRLGSVRSTRIKSKRRSRRPKVDAGVQETYEVGPSDKILKSNLHTHRVHTPEEISNKVASGEIKHQGKNIVPRPSRKEVIRIRAHDRKSVHYNFTKIDVDAEDHEDPLHEEGIKKAGNYKQWSRKAKLSLPSKIGVPIEGTGDVIHAGLEAVDANKHNDFDAKAAYHNVFDEMQKHLAEEEEGTKDHDSDEHEITGKKNTLTITKKVSALRVLADHLSKKRHYKREIIEDGKARNILHLEQRTVVAFLGRTMRTVHNNVHDMVQACMFWEKAIKNIHGKFGLIAATYFRWLRTILIMNLFYLFIVLVLLVFPEMGVDSLGPRLPLEATWDSCPDHPFTKAYKNRPRECPLPDRELVYPPKKPFHLSDIFIGRGYLENTYLFYSGYRDTAANLTCPNKAANPLPFNYVFQVTGLRFVLVTLIIFIANSVFVALQIIRFFHVARLESKVPGMTQKDHFKSVLCAWDFSCSDPLAAKALHASIRRELREVSSGLRHTKSQMVKALNPKLFACCNRQFGKKTGATVLHWAANIGVLITCLLAGGIIYCSFAIRNWLFKDMSKKCEFQDYPEMILCLPALIISITTHGMTKLCVILAKFEAWSSVENRNFAMVARVGLFYVTNVGVLYGYWYYHSENDATQCYETIFGQELYRIIIFQGILRVLGPFACGVAYDYYKKRKDPQYTKPEFDSATDSLNTFFLHTIGGLGVIFCPMISLLIVIRLIMTFYHRKYTLEHLSSFPTHLAHMSEIAAPYLATFFVSYMITSFMNVLLLAEFTPASVCGPFMHFAKVKTPNKIENGHYSGVFKEGFEATTSGFFEFVTKPGLAMVVILILLSVCYTLRCWANAYISTMENIHEMLLLERKDREFLLKAVFRLVKRQADENEGIIVDEDEEALEHILDPDEDDEEGGGKNKKSSWKMSDMAKGIFGARRGSMAKDTNFSPKKTQKRMSSRKSRDFNAVLKAAVKPTAVHHATFRRESVDHWLKQFLKSKRATRRPAIPQSEEALLEIKMKIGKDYVITKHEDRSDDEI